jgi:hypothetical protein
MRGENLWEIRDIYLLELNAGTLKTSQARYLAAHLFVSVFMETMTKEMVLARKVLR